MAATAFSTSAAATTTSCRGAIQYTLHKTGCKIVMTWGQRLRTDLGLDSGTKIMFIELHPRSTMGLAGRPGTLVLPTCSIRCLEEKEEEDAKSSLCLYLGTGFGLC